MRAACPGISALAFLERLETRLVAIELDPVSAWMAQVMLEVAMLPVCREANARLPLLVRQANALECDTAKQYDLVMGNPPYGKVRLDAGLRRRFERSLFGHANLYGMFIDLGASLLAPNGVLAYVVPTSFLGGQYFKALRATMSAECPLSDAAFIDTRDTVFADVLQETMLVVFRKTAMAGADQEVCVHACEPTISAELVQKEVGRVRVGRGEAPWILPRRQEELALTSVLARMSGRLADYGYRVNTGQLVWNRHKPQLFPEQPSNGYPIVWAESVRAQGFALSASKRNHAPWLQLLDGQRHLLTDRECLLMQRTTAKEQSRRLIAGVLPQTVLDQYGAVVVENHLNILMPEPGAPVSLPVLAQLLANPVVDRAYRCISGSVAVSAYELESLPLPTLEHMLELQEAFSTHQSATCLHQGIAALYGE
jgi:tRNA1(Val) A37 N6-methylase TrmN6